MQLRLFVLWAILLVACAGCKSLFSERQPLRVLVFSKTEGFRHASIPDGQRAILELGQQHGFSVDTTENAEYFTDERLRNYHAVIFLCTTGDVLAANQQIAFQRYIQAGGGYVGIHSATDTEYDWPWYGKLVGAYFDGHPNDPNIRDAVLDVIEADHPAVAHLPARWERSDEWYNYKDLNPAIKVLLNLDESSYEGGTNGDNHPITWYHEYDGGRAFYTGLGHTSEAYATEDFRQLIWGGIQYAMNDGEPLDYGRAGVMPEQNRFTKAVLADNLNEPVELDLLPDGRILFIERAGKVKLYDPRRESVRTINDIPVYYKEEDGLIGLALDPAFAENKWVYLFYSVPDSSVNRLSRFTFAGNRLDRESETLVIEVPVQRQTCCHTGGSVEFGPDGLLYMSTGDNVNPFESSGYSPSDERPGRAAWDAQGSSSNTNDLRGKILRIRPLPAGGYAIPEDNLFAEGTPNTRPEIYVMGCRNPYRISIDHRTGYVYWGDVGPDAGEDDPNRGPRGHDEVNQARRPGYFGWPLFVADNKAYRDYDFTTKVAGDHHNPTSPVNTSPNNTGRQQLPPAQPAFIYYPYAESPEFPLTGTGGRNAMAGPVYYHADFTDQPAAYPAYYDKKLFTYDWMRGWIMSVTMNEVGDLTLMERFLPAIPWSNPIDMLLSPQGDLYVLEYGKVWFSQNEDARLVHLKYNPGNRKPVADMVASAYVGAAPLNVRFNGGGSVDYDQDRLTYRWKVENDATYYEGKSLDYTFETPGSYTVSLRVSDAAGLYTETSQEVTVGNEPPTLAWQLPGNQTYFDDSRPLEYRVEVADREDGSVGEGIAPERVFVSIDYLTEGKDANQIAMGHAAMQTAAMAVIGERLIGESDCSSCHQMDVRSVGPSYLQIAERYREEDGARQRLANKIIQGGGGVWGAQAMAAHPQISQEEANQMVAYIFSLDNTANGQKVGLPPSGEYAFTQHEAAGKEGSYILTASYTDRGGRVNKPLMAREVRTLKRPILTPANGRDLTKTELVTLTTASNKQETYALQGAEGGYVRFPAVDLTQVKGLQTRIYEGEDVASSGVLEWRIDAPDGPLVASMLVGGSATTALVTVATEPVPGKHDLFLVFRTQHSLPVGHVGESRLLFELPKGT